ncbi:MAG TPA: 30S ribosomal protein S11 [Verrucomicrobiae bacterium]|nr:30S ribosomal protein S11 [Verrucomicrobiae bacterium]
MADNAKKSTARRKKAVRKNVGLGVVHVLSSFNNTQVTMTDSAGNVLAWGTAGAMGFKGARKSTPYAATQVTNGVLEKIKPMGISGIEIRVSGIGTGRDAALRAISASGIAIHTIHDITPLPHNGCRPKKARRV